jgi:hypothetical protein
MRRLIIYYSLSFFLVLPLSVPASLLFNGGFPMFVFTIFWIIAIQYILYRFLLKSIDCKRKWHLRGGSFLSVLTAIMSFYAYIVLLILEMRDGLLR